MSINIPSHHLLNFHLRYIQSKRKGNINLLREVKLYETLKGVKNVDFNLGRQNLNEND